MKGHGDATSLDEVRAEVADRLKLRYPEIVDAIQARIEEAVPNPRGGDPAYKEGVRAAVTAVVGYMLEGIRQGPEWNDRLPAAAVAQARRAAWAEAGVGVVLRRCLSGNAVLEDFIAEEVERGRLPSAIADHLRRTQATLLDHLTASMERAYVMEEERLASSPEQRRLQLLKRLLAAEPVDQEEMGELDYELDNRWHLGAIASGPNVERFLRRLEADFGAKLLLVSAGGCDWWAWFSRPRGLRVSVLERNLATKPPNGVCMAVGEPGTGLVGWRRTHEEARLASAVAMRKPQRLTRCADVLLDVAFMEHQRLTEFLLRTYSWPLASLHKHGAPARATLRAYFDHGRNISCTASTLKVSRKTVEDRLKAVEKALDRSLNTCVAELDLALRLEALGCGAGLDSQDE